MRDDDIFDRLWDRIARRVKSKPVFSDENLNDLNKKEMKKAENPILNAIDELFEAYEKFQKGEEDMSIKVKDLDEMKKEAEEMNNKLSKEAEETATETNKTEKTEEIKHSGRYSFEQSAPWVSYVHKLKALFGQDPDIRIDYIEDMNEVKLYIDSRDKYEALDYLLPKEKVFGNVKLHIALIPSNDMVDGPNIGEMLRDAFKDNPIFSRTVDTKRIFDDTTYTYVMFHKEVAQYFDDNLADLNGMRSALYQDIADEVFRDMLGDKMRVQEMYSVHFCTEVE